VDHGAALGTDFAAADGSFILAAPSGGGMAPYENGIWWLDPAAGPGPTLVLPELPSGWAYEGWVASQDGPVSTGRFTSVMGEDSDGTGPDAGDDPGPPFPGQDFVDPARDLTAGYAAVISVEPEPDNSSAPFAIKPLLDLNIDDVGEGVLQPMARNTAALPSGNAVLLREHYVAAAAHVGGVNQTVWRTDLDILNSGSRSEQVIVEFLAADLGKSSHLSASVVLAPYTSVRYVDAIDSLFGTEGVGALRILADGRAVRATSRSYNDEDDGSYGQGIPTMDRAIGFGQVGRLLGLSESGNSDAGFRTNIGLVNVGLAVVEVQIDLYRGDGTYLGSVTETLEGFEQTQINGVFPEAAEVGYAEVWTSTAGGRFLTYGSVVDNRTGDPTFVVAR